MGATTSKQNLATRPRRQRASVKSPSSGMGREVSNKRTNNCSSNDRRRSIDLELGGGSNHTQTTHHGEPSEHSENSAHKVVDCRANDRMSLAQALDDMDEISNHSRSMSSHDSVIYIVRSDKLSFKGKGIRRHSRRKRRRQHGSGDNTRIVVLRQPMRHESTVMPQIQATIKEESLAESKSTSKKAIKTTVAPVTPVRTKKSLNCKKNKNVRTPSTVMCNSTSTDFMVFEETSEDLLSVSLRRDFQPMQ
jgi:hypothetical protein